ncbi:FtsW/RodA/SpoVE family cell cycle protein [Paenibacillus sp. YAF4_2]|uniref:FtsW/RodA/SpoVE family cell cycle protein n=1 Tax=Paenibacillus sp. YAF4_2 TaxID=3233085 RepID=UPI003F949BBC
MIASYRLKVAEYLDQVCLPVKAKEMHPEIKLEIEAHLEAIIEELLAEGLSEEAALDQAIAQMGDPNKLGVQFHKVHKPQTDWNLLVLVGLLLGTGMVAMFAMRKAVTTIVVHFVGNTLFYGVLGLLVMAAIYFWDYRKLNRWSLVLYIATASGLLLTKRFGLQVDGDEAWIRVATMTINVSMVSIYAFILAIAGMMKPALDNQVSLLKRSMVYIIELLLYVLVPAWIYLTISHISMFVLYMIGLSVLLLISRRWKTWLSYITVMTACGSVLVLLDNKFSYTVEHILHQINSIDSNYIAARSMEAIRSAGLMGNGFGISMDQIPFFYSNMMFTYLIYSLGWITGVLVASLIAALMVRVWIVTRIVADPYGRNVIAGSFGIIAAQYVLNMLMTAGLLPVMDITMPMISYGGFNLVLNLVVIGFILSVYRRKNMIPSVALHQRV